MARWPGPGRSRSRSCTCSPPRGSACSPAGRVSSANLHPSGGSRGVSSRPLIRSRTPQSCRDRPGIESLVELLHAAGVEVVRQGGVVSGEVLGLEIARVVVDASGSRLEVGVGRHDREAFSVMHGDIPAAEALATVVGDGQAPPPTRCSRSSARPSGSRALAQGAAGGGAPTRGHDGAAACRTGRPTRGGEGAGAGRSRRNRHRGQVRDGGVLGGRRPGPGPVRG